MLADSHPLAEQELKKVRHRLRRFDRVSALLESMLGVAAALVLLLLFSWLALRILPTIPLARPLELLSLGGEEEGMAGDSPEMGENALPDTTDAPIGTEEINFEDTEIAQVLSSVLDAASELELDLSDPSQVKGIGSGAFGQAGGQGQRGTGAGAGGVPSFARWDIRYPSQSLNEYAAALDFFGIELGVVRPGKILLLAKLSSPQPIRQESPANDERLYFQWKDSARQRADAELLRSKGVEVDGATIVQFIPKSLEEKLLWIELTHAGRPVENIRKTKFGIRSSGNDFDIYVVEQTYTR